MTSLRQRRINELGGGDFVRCVRERVVNGRRLADIHDSNRPITATDCLVLSNEPLGAPESPWKEADGIDPSKHPEVFVIYRSGGRKPVVLGAYGNPDIDYVDDSGDARSEPDNINTTHAAVGDHVITAGDGTKIVRKANGDLAIESNGVIELKIGNQLIFSSAGESNDGIPSLVSLVELLNEIVSALNTLILWAQTVESPTGPLVPVPPNLPPASSVRQADSEDLAVPLVRVPSR